MARTNLKRHQGSHFKVLVAKLLEHDQALDAVMGDGAATDTEVVTSGALSVVKTHTNLSCTGTQAYTLAAGTKGGQLKTIRTTTAASTPIPTITFTGANAGANISQSTHNTAATTDFLMLRWDASTSKWNVVYNVGWVLS